MKKLFTVAVAALLGASSVKAQVNDGFRFGVTASLNAANVTGGDNKANIGGELGGLAEYNFNKNLYLQAGLNFQTKGFQYDREGAEDEKTVNFIYLNIPIHVGGRVEFASNKYIFFQAGPQIGLGLAGNKIDYLVSEADFGDYANRFEFGVGGKVGVELNKWQIHLKANYGITEVFKDEYKHLNGYKLDAKNGHNLDFGIGAAYMF